MCLLNGSTGMLDHIIVETGGVKMPLNHLAVVSVLDPKTLSVNPYDPNVRYVPSRCNFRTSFNSFCSALHHLVFVF